MWVANFEHPRGSTCSLYASPTGLSPYLRFGCLSCRVLYYNLRELYMKVLSTSVTQPSQMSTQATLVVIKTRILGITFYLQLLFLAFSGSSVSAAVHLCLCSASCYGGSSSTPPPPTTQTLTAWKQTPSVSRWADAALCYIVTGRKLVIHQYFQTWGCQHNLRKSIIHIHDLPQQY